MLSLLLTVAAELAPDYALTLPWYVWGLVGSAVATMIVTLFRSFIKAIEARDKREEERYQQMIAREDDRAAKLEALVREMMTTMAGTTAALQQLAAAVKESDRG